MLENPIHCALRRTHVACGSIPGGLLIALDRLTELSPSADSSLAYVGPGDRWGQIYGFLKPYGKLW